MLVWMVWDNDDYGSMMSPSKDYIDGIYATANAAQARADELNDTEYKKSRKWSTKARVESAEVKN